MKLHFEHGYRLPPQAARGTVRRFSRPLVGCPSSPCACSPTASAPASKPTSSPPHGDNHLADARKGPAPGRGAGHPGQDPPRVQASASSPIAPSRSPSSSATAPSISPSTIAPCTFHFRRKTPTPIPYFERSIGDRTVREATVKVKPGDWLVMISDGELYAGVGGRWNLGWGTGPHRHLPQRTHRRPTGAQELADDLIHVADHFYSGAPGDDASVVAIKARERRFATLFVGPPVSRRRDKEVVEQFLASPKERRSSAAAPPAISSPAVLGETPGRGFDHDAQGRPAPRHLARPGPRLGRGADVHRSAAQSWSRE